MKRNIWKAFAVLFALICLLFGAACGEKQSEEGGAIEASVEKTDGFVAITVTKMEGEAVLSSVMEMLQSEGEISFTFDGTGMLIELEGVQNAADWSACWMLYTSDAELADATYSKEWKGARYGSAVVGATQLPVCEGCVYLWSYDAF